MKKNSKGFKIFALIIFILVSIFFGLSFGLELMDFMNLFPETYEIFGLLLAFGIFALALYIEIIIHELGHLVFGLITKYKFLSFRIGKLMLIKEGKKLKFKTLSITGTDGQCLMSPPDLEDDKIPVVLYNLGGIFFNLISSFVFILLLLLFNDNVIPTFIFKIFIITGLFFAGLNGIPLQLGPIANDGYNALSLKDDKHAIKSFWTQLKINEMMSKNKRLKDIPEEWFTLPKNADYDNIFIATIAVFECNRLMDIHNFQEANKKIKTLLKRNTAIAGIHKNLLICDQIYCELISNNPQVAKKLCTQEIKTFMESMRDYPTVIRTNYALALLLNNNQKEADKYLTQFRKRTKTYPYQGDMKSERELISIVTSIKKDK